MRIAHALQMPLLQQGGVEVLVRTLIEDASGDDTLFLVSQDSAADLTSSGLMSRLAGHFAVPHAPLTQPWNRELLEQVKTWQIDLCHFHLSGTYGWKARSWSGCPITLLAHAGIPVVVTNHQATCFFDSSGSPRPYWRRWVAAARVWPGKARQLSAVRWEASVSQHDLDLSRRRFPGLSSKMIQVYHSRLDAGILVSPPPLSKTILNVATVAFRKGQHLLVEAFAKVADEFPDWNLLLVGYHAEKACLERICDIIRYSQLENRIALHGPDPDPSRFYEACELYVQPSLLEGLGLSLQEAMFHGRACIGSDIGGIPELINDPSIGVLFPHGDTAALAATLAKLMRDSPERKRLGESARRSIIQRGMTRQAMTATYSRLYSQALSKC